MSTPPRWEVVALANEAPDLIITWAAYHLSLGAARIHLFLERPEPKLLSVLGADPRIAITIADLAFWQHYLQGRPRRVSVRQRFLLQEILDSSDADWVFHIDVDEYLAGQGDVASALAAQPGLVDYACVRSAERVYLSDPDPQDIYCGVFRRRNDPADQRWVDRADRAAAPLLDEGMTAYAAGKSAFRPRRGLTAGVHYPRPQVPTREGQVAGFELLHFDGLTPRHWSSKRQRQLRWQPDRRQIDAAFRRAQLAEITRRSADLEGLRALYLELKQLDPARARALDALGVLVHAHFDPRPALAEVFPDVICDLTEAGFDSYDILSEDQPASA